mmetsp:Transcript_13823/g.19113  ORF Transcript_13823/g.19113 Transcript_13823/m.19113 type:complete len:179 (+) Transcript_13823:106-642(+)
MPEVHMVGTINGAQNIPFSKVYLHWKVVMDEDNWSILGGKNEGCSQIDATENSFEVIWNHPIDIHFSTTLIEGWPKLILEVWRLDLYDRHEIAGYGCLALPAAPGRHELAAAVWRPLGGWAARLKAFLLGGSAQARYSEEFLLGSQRHNLRTESLGFVTLSLQVITHSFEQHGAYLGS